MKQICKNCSNWQKVSGTIKRNDLQGLCSFLNSRIYLINTTEIEPERDKKNKSLIINSSTEVFGEIANGLHVHLTGNADLVYRHDWVWTDGNFGCTSFVPF